MSCILAAYLREQELTCLRIAKASNDGTEAQKEWLRTAQVLIDRAAEHKETCKKCKQE